MSGSVNYVHEVNVKCYWRNFYLGGTESLLPTCRWLNGCYCWYVLTYSLKNILPQAYSHNCLSRLNSRNTFFVRTCLMVPGGWTTLSLLFSSCPPPPRPTSLWFQHLLYWSTLTFGHACRSALAWDSCETTDLPPSKSVAQVLVQFLIIKVFFFLMNWTDCRIEMFSVALGERNRAKGQKWQGHILFKFITNN